MVKYRFLPLMAPSIAQLNQWFSVTQFELGLLPPRALLPAINCNAVRLQSSFKDGTDGLTSA